MSSDNECPPDYPNYKRIVGLSTSGTAYCCNKNNKCIPKTSKKKTSQSSYKEYREIQADYNNKGVSITTSKSINKPCDVNYPNRYIKLDNTSFCCKSNIEGDWTNDSNKCKRESVSRSVNKKTPKSTKKYIVYKSNPTMRFLVHLDKNNEKFIKNQGIIYLSEIKGQFKYCPAQV